MLSHYDRLNKMQREYPTQLEHKGWSCVFVIGDSQGFTLDGWINALWESL